MVPAVQPSRDQHLPEEGRHLSRPQPAPAGGSASAPAEKAGHVCPWWLGPFLVSPLRRLFESPEKILAPHVRPGMTVLEPGCGMGYFSLPLARLVGPDGKVICVDVQPRMIEGLRRRARRAGLLDGIDASVCTPGDLGLSRWRGQVDLAVAIHTVHEVGDARGFLEQIAAALHRGGTLLLLEPRGHVLREAFEETIALARSAGLVETERPAVRRKLAAVLVKEEVSTAAT